MPSISQDEFDLDAIEAPNQLPLYVFREPLNCELFAGFGPILSLSTGYVLKVGGFTNHCYLVLSGSLAASFHSYSASGILSAFFLEGSLFLEPSTLSKQPAALSFQALEPTKIMRIARDDLKQAMMSDVVVFDAVLHSISIKLAAMQEQLRQAMTLDIRARIYYMLLSIAGVCGKAAEGNWVKLTLKVTQQQMSDMLGVNRVTVNNALQNLYERHVIRKESGFYCVNDAKGLLQEGR